MQTHKQQLIFGRHPVLQALENNQVDKILILKDSRGPIIDEIKAEAKKTLVPVKLITEEVLQKILFKQRIQHEVRNQGILAEAIAHIVGEPLAIENGDNVGFCGGKGGIGDLFEVILTGF